MPYVGREANSFTTVVDVTVSDDLTVTDDATIGGDLNVSGATTITTADNSDNLTLVSTDADANFGPNLAFYRNSANPADDDLLAQIDFTGRNDNSQDVLYANIQSQIIDASDGTEDGRFQINTIVAGTDRNRFLLTPTETAFNDNSIDLDFRVESNGNTHMLFVDGGNDAVGIGTSSPNFTLQVDSQRADATFDANNLDTWADFKIQGQTASGNARGIYFDFDSDTGNDKGAGIVGISGDATGGVGSLGFITTAGNSSAERMRIDSSGNLLVGMTSANTNNDGVGLRADGLIHGKRAGVVATFNRKTSDGNVVEISKDNTVVGTIGTSNSGIEMFICGLASTCSGVFFNVNGVLPMVNGSVSDNTEDLGQPDLRWDDVHATNGTIQTSDENEKQNIASMTTAELAVGKSISALFKTFRWKDKVASKGNDARTHSGIIAQQVKAAFEAESLDATKYALFCSNTWWEHDVNVDAVEADDTANPPIEAVDAYTRTDRYYTEDDAPSGSTKKTRMGIRYPELLSFLASYNEARFTAIETRIKALEDA